MEKKLTTKELLMRSMLEISEKKPIEKITVEELTKNCGVSRKSFYNNFLDKYDLIEWIHYRHCSEIAREHASISPLVSCTEMFTYICQNMPFYRNLARRRSEDIHQILYRVSYNVMAEYIRSEAGREELTEEEDYLLSCYIHGSVTKMTEWLSGKEKLTDETVARYITLAWPVGLSKYLHIHIDDLTGGVTFKMNDQNN